MASGINERIWLEWLVKVRVIIITILLAIELAIVNLTATNVNRRLFVLVILAWYAVACRASGCVHLPPAQLANAVQAAGRLRPDFRHCRHLHHRRH